MPVKPIAPLPGTAPDAATNPGYQGSDVLGGLVKGSLAPPPYGSDVPLYDVPSPGAILQYATTGQEPQVDVPSGGPIGSMLQHFGIRASQRPMTQGERAVANIARQQFLSMPDEEKIKALDAITKFGMEFGTTAAQKIAPQVEPSGMRVEQALEGGVPGKGAIAMQTAQMRYLENMAKSDAQQKVAEAQALRAQAAQDVAEGRLDIARQNLQLAQDREKFAKQQKEDEPTFKAAMNLSSAYTRQWEALARSRSALAATPLTAPEALQSLDDQMNAINVKIAQLNDAMGKGPEALRKYNEESLKELTKPSGALGPRPGGYAPFAGGMFGGGDTGGTDTGTAPGGGTSPR